MDLYNRFYILFIYNQRKKNWYLNMYPFWSLLQPKPTTSRTACLSKGFREFVEDMVSNECFLEKKNQLKSYLR